MSSMSVTIHKPFLLAWPLISGRRNQRYQTRLIDLSQPELLRFVTVVGTLITAQILTSALQHYSCLLSLEPESLRESRGALWAFMVLGAVIP